MVNKRKITKLLKETVVKKNDAALSGFFSGEMSNGQRFIW